MRRWVPGRGVWTVVALLSFQANWAHAVEITPRRQVEQREYVEIVFLDVGQGDAAVIRSPEGEVALVDAGGSVVELLAALEIESIEVAVASHAHADHIGGMSNVLRSLPVGYYMDNGLPHNTPTYVNLMLELEDSDVTYLEPVARTIGLGSAKLQVLPPPGLPDQNDNSVGLVLEYGEFKALFTGDSEVAELQHFLSLGVPDVTVLKAPHHGSRNGVTPAWLSATKPEVVVISCGRNNQYGHPDEWALRYYQAARAEVFRTDLDGDVMVHGQTDGTFEVVTSGDRHVPAGAPALGEPAGGAAVLSAPSVARLDILVVASAPGNDHYNLNGEYVTMGNVSAQTLDIGGWTLYDAAGHCYTFPPGAEIAGRGSVAVYTGRGVNDGVHFFMNRGRAVWNNRGDTATLKDVAGRVVGTYAY